ncbi:MAG: TonB family protein [Candidatus Acidiferrales bacterium]
MKDTLEVSNPAAETAVSHGGSPARPAGGQMRADALSLEVPVKIHGSRVKEIVRGVTPHTEPFEEQSSTMIVFPQGAVLRMATTVNAGQMLVVTNLKTRQDAICRVVKVRANANLQGYIEVEFTHRQPGYWGVHFPSEGSVTANKIASPASPVSATPERKPWSAAPEIPGPSAPASSPKSAPVAARPLAPPPAAGALKSVPNSVPNSVLSASPAAKPDSAFIAIGTQEKVQPAASATVTTKPSALPKDSLVTPTVPHSPVMPLPPVAPSATLSMDDLRGDQESDAGLDLAALLSSDSSEALAEDAASTDTVGRSSSPAGVVEDSEPEATVASQHIERSSVRGSASFPEVFAERSNAGMDAASSDAAAPDHNWMLIAAGIALLLVASAGGLMYFRSRSAHPAPSVATNSVRPAEASNSVAPAVDDSGPSVVVHANAAPAPVKSAAAEPKNSAAEFAPKPVPKQSTTGVTNSMMSASLAAHPIASAHTAEASDAAPTIDAGATSANQPAGLPGVIPTPSAISVPAPAIQPAGPVKIGGQVKEPKLISYVSPVYPQVAKESGVEGDVVIRTTIDKTGHVTGAQVVSGPAMLRQPAVTALRRWKYEPSKLDGQPVSVQVLVTIKFRR